MLGAHYRRAAGWNLMIGLGALCHGIPPLISPGAAAGDRRLRRGQAPVPVRWSTLMPEEALRNSAWPTVVGGGGNAEVRGPKSKLSRGFRP